MISLKRRLQEAGAAFRAGDFAEAADSITSDLLDAVETGPAADLLRLVQAVALLRLSRAQEALSILSPLADAPGASPFVARALAAAQMATGDTESALRSLA